MPQHSFGSKIGYYVGSILTNVAEVVNIDGPGQDVTVAPASHLRVPNAAKKFLPGLIDGGEVTFTCRCDGADGDDSGDAVAPSGYVVLNALLQNRSEQRWAITWGGDGTLHDFYGFIQNLSPAIPEDDTITCDVTIKVSGLVSVSV